MAFSPLTTHHSTEEQRKAEVRTSILNIMKGMILACLLASLALGVSSAEEKEAPASKAQPEKRGLLGLGYGGFGHAGLYDASPLLLGHAGGYLAGHHGVEHVHKVITVTKEVPVAVPHPVPVPVIKHVGVPVPHPVPYPVDKPYPVAVPKPYPVPVDKPYPVPVDRPYPVPVHVPVKVPVPHPVPVHVPKPVAVPVSVPVKVPVPHPVAIHKPVPIFVHGHGGDYAHGGGFDDFHH